MEQKPLHEEDAARMFGVTDEDLCGLDVMEHRAMVYLPENAVEVKIDAKVFQDGKIVDVSKTLKMSDLRTAFQKADDGYIDEEDRFEITEKGMAYLEELKKTY